MIPFILSVLFSMQIIATTPTSGSLELRVTNLESEKGLIRVLIFSSSDGFPEDPSKAIKALSIPIKSKKASLKINDLQAGNYAISVFHDENEDGKIRKNFFGYPLNKFGFSNNPNGFLSIPSFSRCAFSVEAGQYTYHEIVLR